MKMNIRTSILTLVLTSGLLGCAGSKVWYRADRTPDETRQDLARAKLNAQERANPLGFTGFSAAGEINKNNLIHDQMEAWGYQQIPARAVPTNTVIKLGPRTN